MALVPATMVSGFTALFQGGALGAVAGANQMASIYASYAMTGMFGTSLPVFTGAEKGVLASTLAAVFALPAPNPGAFASAWISGLTTFWLSPPIVVTGAQTGVVTAIVPASLTAALGALVATPMNTAAVAAARLAAALHTATLTCMATVAPPPATVVPIS